MRRPSAGMRRAFSRPLPTAAFLLRPPRRDIRGWTLPPRNPSYAPRSYALSVSSGPVLRIEGVVDVHAHRHLCTALDVIAPTKGDLQLEFSRLEFLDLGGLRRL